MSSNVRDYSNWNPNVSFPLKNIPHESNCEVTVSIELIADIESRLFRTIHDTGSGINTLCVWNAVRRNAGLTGIRLSDLPHFCETHKKYHVFDGSEPSICVKSHNIIGK